MQLDEAQLKEFNKSRLLALVIGVVAPILYLVIAHQMKTRVGQPGGHTDMVFYILLVVACLEPLLIPLIERFQLSAYRSKNHGTMSPAQLATSMVIIRMAVVASAFIYGLVSFILSGELTRMYYFYPIGAVWMVVHWPRRDKYAQFIEKATQT